jgi:UPF0716 protein FxsA
MMRIPFLALIAVPIAELYLLFAVADKIGGLATLGLVILTAGIGLSVLKRQGFNTLNRANARMQSGQLPGQEIIEGMMLAVAGALLLTPGLITDTVGFLLLTPPVRRYLAGRAMRKGSTVFMGGFRTQYTWQQRPGGPFSDGDIIDGEVVGKESANQDDALHHDGNGRKGDR